MRIFSRQIPAGDEPGLSTGELLGQWLSRTAGQSLTGRSWRLSDPLDRGSRYVEAAAPPPCTVIGQPRAGGQAAVARGVLSGYPEPVALRAMLASTDPRAQQREKLQTGIGQLSRTHRRLLPALVRTLESFLMSLPAEGFYHPDRHAQPGSATVEVWMHVLEWCPRTLSDELSAVPGEGLGAETAVRLLLPVMRTLIGMHTLGYVHRDLDPSNILVTEDGSLRIADFGIAVHLKTEHTHTMTEAWGKPGRMPPEALQAQHVPVGPAYDAWQAGFVLAEAATGGRPVLPDGGVSPRLNDLPGEVRAVVQALLEADRSRRLDLAAAVASLEEWLEALELSRRPKVVPVAARRFRPAPPRRLLAWSAAVAVLCAVIATVVVQLDPWDAAEAGSQGRTPISPLATGIVTAPTPTSPRATRTESAVDDVRFVPGAKALAGITMADGTADATANPELPHISSAQLTCGYDYFDNEQVKGVTYEETAQWSQKKTDLEKVEYQKDMYHLDADYSRFSSKSQADSTFQGMNRYVRCLMSRRGFGPTSVRGAQGSTFAAYRVYTENKPYYGQYKGGVQLTVTWHGSSSLISMTIQVPNKAARTASGRLALARTYTQRALDDTIRRIPRSAR